MAFHSNVWCGAGELEEFLFAMKIFLSIKKFRKGFTLLEMLVAMTVAVILTTVSLNVYSMFHHGTAAASDNYVRFATEHIDDLRCRTRFVRGLPPCDTASRESRTYQEFRNFQTLRNSRASRDDIRTRF